MPGGRQYRDRLSTSLVAASAENRWNVLELSSFPARNHLSSSTPLCAVAMNVTPDHLDRHYTFENYAAAKSRLFETQRAR